MLAKDIPISEIAIPAVIQANLAGADLVMLAGPNHKPGQKIMVKPEIKRHEDLKSKRSASLASAHRMIFCCAMCWVNGVSSPIATWL